MALLWLSRWLHMRWQDFGSGRRCVTEGSAVLEEGIVAIPLQSPLSYLGGDHNGDGMDDGDGDV